MQDAFPGIPVISLQDYPDIAIALAGQRKQLKADTNPLRAFLLTRSIQRIRKATTESDRSTADAYDTEYGGKVPYYGYASAILSKEGFERITGIEGDAAFQMHIIDIGTGSGEFLRFCRDSLHIPAAQLSGSDLSPKSKDIVERDGFNGYVGRIEDLELPKDAFNLAYLSYFIDYDTNQQATFDGTATIVRPGGRIVLEGYFPVRPFALSKSDLLNRTFVTKGVTAEEDIQLVIAAFEIAGTRVGKTIRIEQIAEGKRHVRSHYGLWTLPSYFLTFTVS